MFCVVLFSFSSETLRRGWQQPEAIRLPFKCQRWIHCSGGWLQPIKNVQHPLLRCRPSTCIISSDMLYYIIDCFEWWTVNWISLLLCRIVHGIHVAVFHLGFLGDYILHCTMTPLPGSHKRNDNHLEHIWRSWDCAESSATLMSKCKLF